MYSQFTFKREMRYTRKWEKKTERRREPKERREEKNNNWERNSVERTFAFKAFARLPLLPPDSSHLDSFESHTHTYIHTPNSRLLQIRVQLLTSWEEGDDPLMSSSPSHRRLLYVREWVIHKTEGEGTETSSRITWRWEQMGRGKRNICQTRVVRELSRNCETTPSPHVCIPKQRRQVLNWTVHQPKSSFHPIPKIETKTFHLSYQRTNVSSSARLLHCVYRNKHWQTKKDAASFTIRDTNHVSGTRILLVTSPLVDAKQCDLLVDVKQEFLKLISLDVSCPHLTSKRWGC